MMNHIIYVSQVVYTFFYNSRGLSIEPYQISVIRVPYFRKKAPLQKQSFADVLKKKIAIFTGKHLCWSLFLIKLQAFRPFDILSVILTHFKPKFHFYTPLKMSENQRFSDVFREYRSETLALNGLKFDQI